MRETEIRSVIVDGMSIRIGIRAGMRSAEGAPLLVCNGIGANLELLEQFTAALTDIETITFDVPGVGASEVRLTPYRFRGLARFVARLLDRLGYDTPVDVLGVSWGGALAQQFAHTCRDRCRRLVLAATTAGALMVPGSPFVLSKLINPRRYNDPQYLYRIAPRLYGGEVRGNPHLLEHYVTRQKRPHWLGYLHQQLAFCGWTSLPWLWSLRQSTLVIAGNDDPLIPLTNARLLAALIPRSHLHVVDDGHLFLLTPSQRATAVIRRFLSASGEASARLLNAVGEGDGAARQPCWAAVGFDRS